MTSVIAFAGSALAALDAEHQALREKLSVLRAAGQMTSALQEFAGATLPTLKQHLETAHELARQRD